MDRKAQGGSNVDAQKLEHEAVTGCYSNTGAEVDHFADWVLFFGLSI